MPPAEWSSWLEWALAAIVVLCLDPPSFLDVAWALGIPPGSLEASWRPHVEALLPLSVPLLWGLCDSLSVAMFV